MFDTIVEQRIQEAQRKGEFDNLPGSGRPLVLDDDLLVPDEVRVAYRVLKNGGFVPPEVEMCRELRSLQSEVRRMDEKSQAYESALRKLQLLHLRLAETRRSMSAYQQYLPQLLHKLASR